MQFVFTGGLNVYVTPGTNPFSFLAVDRVIAVLLGNYSRLLATGHCSIKKAGCPEMGEKKGSGTFFPKQKIT
jgi:hypothetical protein